MIDAAHRTIQHHRQACAVGLDRCAESFGYAPVHVSSRYFAKSRAEMRSSSAPL